MVTVERYTLCSVGCVFLTKTDFLTKSLGNNLLRITTMRKETGIAHVKVCFASIIHKL